MATESGIERVDTLSDFSEVLSKTFFTKLSFKLLPLVSINTTCALDCKAKRHTKQKRKKCFIALKVNTDKTV
jgi:hypothetical protein